MIWHRLLPGGLVAAALLSLVLPFARAGDVEGTVLLPEKGAKKGPRPTVKYPGGKAPAGEEKQGPAVVFIDGVTEGAPFKPPEEKPKMEQKDRQFSPLALAVLVGTTVLFPNGDDEYHNVFSRSKAKELELGRYGKGESKEVTFDKPGLIRLRCEIHGNMHAVVVVLENPYFAVTDEKGNFSIKGVPPGKYRIHAFHEDYQPKDKDADPLRAVSQEIEVKADGPVKAEFDLTQKEK
ncbi:MAG: hypothetical protein HYY93_04525 [Planctomycetes bacterium]|nr:hypothetical protein [Planctomycetota bacterium]